MYGKWRSLTVTFKVILAILTLKFLEIWLVSVITCYGFELESPNLHQICILGFSQLVLKMEFIDIDLQGLAIVSTQETAFNVAFVFWSRLAKGCYTSQTCSCIVLWSGLGYSYSVLVLAVLEYWNSGTRNVLVLVSSKVIVLVLVLVDTYSGTRTSTGTSTDIL